MLDSKLIAVIIIVILVAIYIFWKRRAASKTSKEKLGKKKNRKERRHKPSRSKATSITDDNDDDDDDDDDHDNNDASEEDAVELYDMVHERMASGMQSQEFKEIAGDMSNDLMFIEIKQLYNDASNKNEDSSQSVTVDDYIEVINRIKAGDE